MKADHEGPGKRPGLTAQVAHAVDDHAHLLGDLPSNAALQGLPRLDETGDVRVHALGPDRLAGEEHAASPVVDQTDHGGVGPWILEAPVERVLDRPSRVDPARMVGAFAAADVVAMPPE